MRLGWSPGQNGYHPGGGWPPEVASPVQPKVFVWFALAAGLAALAVLAPGASATHYRGGTLYTEPDMASPLPYAVRLHGEMYFRSSWVLFSGATAVGTVHPCSAFTDGAVPSGFFFGDGTTAQTCFGVVFVSNPEWVGLRLVDEQGVPGLPHTYPGPTDPQTGEPWVAYWYGSARLSAPAAPRPLGSPGIVNDPDTTWRLEATAVLPNRPPTAPGFPPIVTCPYPAVCEIPINVVDSDSDSTTIEWATTCEAVGYGGAQPVPDPPNPVFPCSPAFAQPGPCPPLFGGPGCGSVAAAEIVDNKMIRWDTTGATQVPGYINYYVAQVKLRDGMATTSLEFLIQMGPPPPPPPPVDPEPVALFTFGDPLLTCRSASLRFTDASTPADDFVSWSWSFGDGSPPETGRTLRHTFTSEGTFLVALTASTASQTFTSTRGVQVSFQPLCMPRIEMEPVRTVMAGQSLTTCAVGRAGMGGTLTYSVQGLPEGATFDPAGPCMRGTPTEKQAGLHACIRFQLVEAPWGLSAWACQAVRVLADGGTVRDTDQDGVADTADLGPEVPDAEQADSDHDGRGDACDPTPLPPLARAPGGASAGPALDLDLDGVADAIDLCPEVPDAVQADLDGDGFGDACDLDRDGDGVADRPVEGLPTPIDNCPREANPDQLDADLDGVGDRCQPARPARMLSPEARLPGKGDAAHIPITSDSHAVAWGVGLLVCALPAGIAVAVAARQRTGRRKR